MDVITFVNQNREHVAEILDLIPVPIYSKSVNGRFLFLNQACLALTDIKREDILGKTPYDIWDKELADLFTQKDQELIASESDHQEYNAKVETATQQVRYVRYSKRVWRNPDTGEIEGILGVIYDRTNEKILEQKLHHKANHDSLTGLLNRRAGLEKLQSYLDQGRDMGLLLIDYDHFKQINDNFTHAGGDVVLQELSSIIDGTIGEEDFLFRYGGEEFVLCEVGSGYLEAEETAEMIRQVIEHSELTMPDGALLQTTVSVGVSATVGVCTDLSELIKRADKALYKAKSNGRNQVCRFDCL